jgi:hypothetical protein
VRFVGGAAAVAVAETATQARTGPKPSCSTSAGFPLSPVGWRWRQCAAIDDAPGNLALDFHTWR